MLTGKEILTLFNSFKEAHGKPVMVHTSLKAIGEIDGGAQTLLSGLIDTFAKEGGLLCIPTHTWDSLKLDLNKTESCLGVLPRCALAHRKLKLMPYKSSNIDEIKNLIEKAEAMDRKEGGAR